MTTKHTRSFKIKDKGLFDGNYTLRFCPEKVAPNARTKILSTVKNDKKFNIRIRAEDVCLLDTLAEHHDITRSHLINHLVHEMLMDELMAIKEMDARALLAYVADQRASYGNQQQSWLEAALGAEWKCLVLSALTYNFHQERQDDEHTRQYGFNSPEFNGLKKKLEGMKP